MKGSNHTRYDISLCWSTFELKLRKSLYVFVNTDDSFIILKLTTTPPELEPGILWSEADALSIMPRSRDIVAVE